MSSNMKKIFILIIFSVIFMIGIGSASATDWTVNPGDSIQSIIDNNASENDTITVNDGGSPYTYNENILINKKNLTIKSNGNVTINASEHTAPVFNINSAGSYSTIQGFKITGSNMTFGWGAVYLSEATGCTISNNILFDNDGGISLILSNYNAVMGNSGSGTIYLGGSSYNTIFNNTGFRITLEGDYNNVTGNSISGYINGVFIGNSALNTVMNNNITDCRCGIRIDNDAHDNNVNNNILTNNWLDGVHIDGGSYNNLVYSNNIYNNADGIAIQGNAQNNTISNNTITNNTHEEEGAILGAGIKIGESTDEGDIESANNNTIQGNVINNNPTGILVIGSSGNIINNNIISKTGFFDEFAPPTAIKLQNSSNNNMISNNSISADRGQGIVLENSNENDISHNIFKNCWMAIILTNSFNNLINENNIDNCDYGITLQDSNDNTIEENLIKTGNFGINLGYSSNTDNNIINNQLIGCGTSFIGTYGNIVTGNTVNGLPMVYLEGAIGDIVTGAGQVILANCINVTVRNCNLSNATDGMEIYGDNTSGLNIYNNIIANNPGYGIYLHGYNSNITNNIVENCWNGIFISWCQDGYLNISNNTLRNCTGNGIWFYQSSHLTLNNNTFEGCGMNCRENYGNMTVLDNTVNGKPLIYWEGVNGGEINTLDDPGQVILVNCTNITVRDCDISNTNVAIILRDSSTCTITNNNIHDLAGLKDGQGTGIDLWNCYGNIINNNTCINNGYGGIALWTNSNNNNITVNIIKNCGNALLLIQSSNNSISNNSLSKCFSGIQMGESSNNNILFNNEITNNIGGLDLWGGTSNQIYNNKFINNVFQVRVSESGNIFNLPVPIGGNYWSDYNGVDDNDDGFGDTPYIFPFDGGSDNLPLIGIGTIHYVNPGDSIQDAVNSANSGDTVIIRDDNGSPYTYTENVTLNKKILIKTVGGEVVTVEALSPGSPVFTINSSGNGSTIQGLILKGSAHSEIYLKNSIENIILNNTINGDLGTSKSLWGICLVNGNENNIENNVVTSCEEGINLYNSHQNQIKNNIVSDCHWDNIALNLSTLNALTENNITNADSGIRLIGGSNNNTISENNLAANIWTSISLVGSGFNQMMGNILSNNQEGMYLYSSDNNMITYNTANNNIWDGIAIHSSDNNTITDNTEITGNNCGIRIIDTSTGNIVSGQTISGNNWAGISLDNASNNTISGNNITNSPDGIFIWNLSNNNTIQGNNIGNNAGNSIYIGLNSIQNVISQNFLNSGYYGVRIENSDIAEDDYNNEIINNQITGYNYAVYLLNANKNIIDDNSIQNNLQSGIYLYNSDYNHIDENNISQNGNGIQIISSEGNMISNWGANQIANNTQYGIYIENSEETTINPNIISGSSVGIALYNNANNSFMDGNTITNCEYGIRILNSSENLIASANLSNNSYGILIENSTYNTFAWGQIENNTHGIYLQNSTQNSIYENNIVNNTNQAYDNGTNNWNNETTGNYWSDWSSTSPRPIAGGSNFDYYPSTTPF